MNAGQTKKRRRAFAVPPKENAKDRVKNTKPTTDTASPGSTLLDIPLLKRIENLMRTSAPKEEESELTPASSTPGNASSIPGKEPEVRTETPRFDMCDLEGDETPTGLTDVSLTGPRSICQDSVTFNPASDIEDSVTLEKTPGVLDTRITSEMTSVMMDDTSCSPTLKPSVPRAENRHGSTPPSQPQDLPAIVLPAQDTRTPATDHEDIPTPAAPENPGDTCTPVTDPQDTCTPAASDGVDMAGGSGCFVMSRRNARRSKKSKSPITDISPGDFTALKTIDETFAAPGTINTTLDVTQTLNTAVLSTSRTEDSERNDSVLSESELALKLSGIPQDLIDSIHLPFDEPAPPAPQENVKSGRRKSRRSMDFTPAEIPRLSVTPEPMETDKTDKEPAPKRRRTRRRSADANLIATTTFEFSPESVAELGGESAPVSIPAPRRSRRIRRKSTDLYRSTLQRHLPVMEEEEGGTAGGTGEVVQDIGATPSTSGGDISATPSTSGGDISVTPSSSGRDISQLDQAMFINESALPEDSMLLPPVQDMDTSIANTSMDVILDESIAEEGEDGKRTRPRRARRKVTEPEMSPEVVTPRRKRKRDPPLEDIYTNKLWREQMPKEKTWETIFESPHVTRTGKHEIMSAKKLKRFVNFDDVFLYEKTRLKKRRAKALKLGWKPMTKKKSEKVETLMFTKLCQLEEDLAKLEPQEPMTSSKLEPQEPITSSQPEVIREAVPEEKKPPKKKGKGPVKKTSKSASNKSTKTSGKGKKKSDPTTSKKGKGKQATNKESDPIDTDGHTGDDNVVMTTDLNDQPPTEAACVTMTTDLNDQPPTEAACVTMETVDETLMDSRMEDKTNVLDVCMTDVPMDTTDVSNVTIVTTVPQTPGVTRVMEPASDVDEDFFTPMKFPAPSDPVTPRGDGLDPLVTPRGNDLDPLAQPLSDVDDVDDDDFRTPMKVPDEDDGDQTVVYVPTPDITLHEVDTAITTTNNS